jgi:hypothetical protein
VKSLLLIPAFILASCISPLNHLAAQQLNWSTPYVDYNVEMTGISQRQAPSAAVFNGRMYMAYASTNSTGDADNDYYVYFGSNSGGSTAYEPVGYINPAGGVAATNLNPALGVFNSHLYLALADYNPVNNFPPSYTAMNTAGQWGVVTGFPQTAADSGSPVSMATDGTYLYMGYRDRYANTLVLCRMNTSQVITCNNFPGSTTMGFSPSLAYLNGSLYIAFQNLGSHATDYYVSKDQGQTIGNLITTAAAGSTSTAPSLVVHNGYLYMGYRTNDGDHKFIYKATSNGGTSWTTGYEPSPTYAMGGNPTLVDGTGLPNYPQYLYNIFAENGSPYYLYTSFGQVP